MRESEIEKRLKNAVKMRGGLALKFVSPNFNGVPDRLLLLPEGKAAFAELKATGRKNCICRDESTRTENEEHTDKAKKAIRSIRFFGVLH